MSDRPKINGDRVLDRVRARDWNNVRDSWFNFIPDIVPSGSAPAEATADIIDTQLLHDELREKNSCRIVDVEQAIGVRQSILAEAIFLLHKAAHVIGTAERMAVDGHPTWAMMNAYQGSLFAAKGVIYLLGVGLPEFGNETLIVDVMPELSESQKRLVKRNIEPAKESEFFRTGRRFDHDSTWKLFQRLIRVSKVNLWSEDHIEELKHLDTGSISDKRNWLQYRAGAWLYTDLHNLMGVPSHGNLSISSSNCPELDPENPDFYMIFSLVVMHLGYLLFEDLKGETNKLTDEWNLYIENLNEHRHPLFHRAFNVGEGILQ
ncbi:MAG: hypothetical protein JWQ71_1785 [Pedosphaera sp.]|nr:hypothetical protein [Pedosphaera sp.]